MGGTDAVLASIDGFAHDVFLEQHNFLEGDFHTQISSGYHDSVGSADDLVEVGDGFVVLDFADEVDVGAVDWVFGDQMFSEFDQISFVPCERYGNVVHLVLQSEFDDIIDVVISDCWQSDGYSGKTHVLFGS